MSYNIDSTETTLLDAWMSARDIVDLLDELEDSCPEDCFLCDAKLDVKARAAVDSGPDCASCGAESRPGSAFCAKCGADLPAPSNEPIRIPLTGFSFSGEGSGRAYEDILLAKIAPKVMGSVDAIFTWEGGDSFSGLQIRDGVITECDVVRTLVPKV